MGLMISPEVRLLAVAKQLNVLSFGQFELASGQSSNCYIDGRCLSLDAAGSNLIGQAIYARLQTAKSVGGPATGALPIVSAVVSASLAAKSPLTGFYLRSQSKDHGLNKLIEGRPVSAALIVDDTCSTGGSLLKVIKLLEARSVEIEQVITIFDRGGGQKITAAGYKYSALLKLDNDQLAVY